MFLALFLLAGVATQWVSEDVERSIRASAERMAADCEYVESARLGGKDLIVRWRIKNPPAANRAMSKGERANREIVRVHVVDCVDPEGAKRRFDEAVSEVGKDGDVKGLGDTAVFRSWGSDETPTTISFRIRMFKVSVSAPNRALAQRFAEAVAGTLANPQSGGDH